MRVKEKLPYLISGVVIFIIVIIFSILYFTEKRKKEERELYQKMMAELERKRQMEKEELERKLEELERKRQMEKEELERKRQEEESARRKYEEARAIREALLAEYMATEVNLRSREQLFQMLEIMRRGGEELPVIPSRREGERLENAYKEIEIDSFKYSPTLSSGGITLEWIMLHNPTDYTFEWVEYEFYDANDNVVRIKDKIGPLSPNETKKFYIDKWVEGLWEHRYDIRIVDGKATE
jgi:hypothetical protein